MIRKRTQKGLFLKVVITIASIFSVIASTFDGLPANASPSNTSALPSNLSGFASNAKVARNIAEGIVAKAYPKDFKDQMARLSAGKNWGAIYPGASSPKCIGAKGATPEPISECTGGDKTSKYVVALIGDSRAGMWGGTFDNVGYLTHFKLINIYKSGCPAPLDNYASFGVATPDCARFHEALIKLLNQLKPNLIVVSSQTEIVVTSPPPFHLAPPDVTQRDLEALIHRLPRTSKVVVLGGFPTPGSNDTFNPTLCLSRVPSPPSSCNFTEILAVKVSNQAFKNAAASSHVGYIDQRPWFCLSTCPPIIGGKVVWTKDAFHANGAYLVTLTGVLAAALAPYTAH